ncbi:hypothetical protein CI109_103941 [Kwoniella shandongensis]|uniref:NADP-dependent oxidoreductase domain-containing protein n=1 Tax=Kwoniella shandongensis TaxID=1734106 RepID=A0A5M6BYH2_9TREE|nr:uncharacterized protein CI109_005605 [Kwoniella shandongensis]KAA5526009.1 hypothetical protein CI109_005605 [Kwoniella shandongensis]
MSSSSHLSPYHPSQPEPNIAPFDITNVPDEEVDKPQGEREILPTTVRGPNEKRVIFPPLIFGASTFGYGIYADDDNVKSTIPLRVVRLAMRCGMNAFDTSPWYHPSEIILGNALSALEYKRHEYTLITKVGKYGPNSRDHTYSSEVVRASVERSLKRLNTDYLDVVYLHDVEYTLPPPSFSGNPVLSIPSILSLPPTPTPEESSVLEGIAALRTLQSEGKIILCGIAGYPLPILLRLALLHLHTTGNPLDVVQTFAHQTIQNDSLSAGYLEALTTHAKVGQVVSAAPLAMGILTKGGGPNWHPGRAYPELWDATRQASDYCEEKGTTLVDVALRFGYRPLTQNDGKRVPIVVGCTDLDQVHSNLQKWSEVNVSTSSDSGEDEKKKQEEDDVRKIFVDKGVERWSWACPSDQQRSG